MSKITGIQEILSDLEKRVEDKILEQSNFDLLKKLVENADTLDEAIKIAELGTTYKRTGFHFDKRLEKQSNTISYFKKNDALSFGTDPNAITHKLIIGDNYPALLNLLVEYKGKIDVIYIDPPYGKDSMGEFAETNYDNAITRDNLLSMLYPRLYVAKQLLSDNGVIFCSIDDKNQAYVKCLFDEIFNETNFVANVIWEKKFSPQNDAKWFSDNHDYIIIYAKTKKEWRPIKLVRTEENNSRYSNPDNDPRGVWASSDMTVRTYSEEYDYPIITPSGKKIMPTKGRCWSMPKHNVEKLIAENRIWFGKSGDNVPRFKTFLSEIGDNGVVPLTIWKHNDVGHNQEARQELKELFEYPPFDSPKPTRLIQQILRLSTNSDAIILDFFAGSGTTGQAVLELNKEDEGQRQFILVTNNEITPINPNGVAIDATSKRLKRVMTGRCYDGTSDFDWIKKNKPLGDNLLVLDIAEVSNFEAVEGKAAFDVIDEALYGNTKFKTVKEKVEWVCDNFEVTQKRLEE